MGFRFRRRLKIAPGVHLNVGKRGFSTSVGVRGANITVGHGKVRHTVGIPGTGLSHTSVSSSRASGPPPFTWVTGVGYIVVLVLCFAALGSTMQSAASGGWAFLIALFATLWAARNLYRRAADDPGRVGRRVAIVFAASAVAWALLFLR